LFGLELRCVPVFSPPVDHFFTHAIDQRVAADRPTGVVEGDKYDTSIATEILVNKFAYHLPIYRQQDLLTTIMY